MRGNSVGTGSRVTWTVQRCGHLLDRLGAHLSFSARVAVTAFLEVTVSLFWLVGAGGSTSSSGSVAAWRALVQRLLDTQHDLWLLECRLPQHVLGGGPGIRRERGF